MEFQAAPFVHFRSEDTLVEEEEKHSNRERGEFQNLNETENANKKCVVDFVLQGVPF